MTYPEDYINKVIQGDCLEVMKDIPDKSIDMILCDLPYGTTACKWDTIIPFEPLWEQYKRIIKGDGVIVLTATNPFASVLVVSNLEMYKYEFIWNKHRPSNPMMAKKQPLRNHEQVLVFYKNPPTYNPQPTKKNTKGMHSKKYENIERGTESYGDAKLVFNDNNAEFGYPKTILNDIPMENNLNQPKSELGLHPTQKSKGLFEYLIKTYTNEGDLVLDNTAGSGTTAVACVQTKRNFILIELSEEYCKIARARIEATKYQHELELK